MAGKSDVKAGGAFVETFVKGAKLEAGLKKFSGQLKSFGEAATSIGVKIAAVGSAAVAGFGVAVKQFAESGDELTKMSQRTGMSVEALSELRHAAKQSGSSLEDIETATKKMSTVLYDARAGSKAAATALNDLGLSVDDFVNKAPERQFMLVAQALSRVEDATLRTALALQIFGRAGTKLLPLFSEGEKGLEALRKEAAALGVTMSSDTAAAATSLGDSMDRVKSALSGVANAIGAALAPSMEELSNRLAEAIGKISEWIRKNQETIIAAAKGAAAIAAFGFVLVGFGKVVTLVGGILFGFKLIIASTATLLSALVSPITLLIAPILAVGAAWIATAAAFVYASGIVPQLVSALAPLLDAIKAITTALLAGDFKKAWDIAAASVRLIGSVAADVFAKIPDFAAYAAGRITRALITGINVAFDWMLKAWHEVTSAIINMAVDLGKNLATAIISGGFSGDVTKAFHKAMETAANSLSALAIEFDAGMAKLEPPELTLSTRTKDLQKALADMTKAEPKPTKAAAEGPNPFALDTDGGPSGAPRAPAEKVPRPDIPLTALEEYEQKILDLSVALGDGVISEEEFIKAKAALDQSFVDLSPIEKYHARMQELKELFDAGIINEQQFKTAQMEALPDKVKDIIERSKTPLQKFSEQITEVRDLFSQGLISREQFAAEQERLQGELRESEKEPEKADKGRVFVTFSGAALAAQGMGGGGSRDILGGKMQKQIDATNKQTEILKAIRDDLAKTTGVFG